MKTSKKIVIWLVVIVIAGGLGFGGYLYWQMRQGIMDMIAQAQRGMDGPMPLPVAECTIQDITESLAITGTTEAINVVEVRARVEGFLETIHFTDGSLVEKDQPLFTIEPQMYRARRDEATARLKAGQTELGRARDDLERIEKAVQTGSVSRQELTRARAAYDAAQAAVRGYQAALDMAELNLGYTEIRSPVTGRIARRMVDVGNLVGALERTVLTTIRQTRPIYVFFHISEHLLEEDLLRRLRLEPDVEPLSLTARLPGQNTTYQGQVDFLDNTVDTRTGTIYVRATLPNEDGRLLPGMYVQVELPIAEHREAVLIPEQAVQSDLGGRFVLIVDEDNTLRRREIELGETIDGMRHVRQGLDGTETFIVGGFHIARPEMPIQPVPEEEFEPEMREEVEEDVPAVMPEEMPEEMPEDIPGQTERTD